MATATIAATALVRTGQWTAGTKRMQRDLDRVNARIGVFARQVVVGLGAAGVAATGFAIKLASDMEETMSKFNVVFGENATEVKAWADSLAESLGRSKLQIAGFMASSQDLFVPLGFAADAATDMSKTVTQLAIDLGSFNNMADEDVLRDLQAALTGSGEVMKKYGVLVSEAAVKQELLNQGMDPKVATDQQKVMARLNIIMAGTTAAQGDAARTADSFANSAKALKADITDLAIDLGTKLLPAATAVVGSIRSMVGMAKIVAAGFSTWQGKMALVLAGITALVVIVPKIIAAMKFYTLAIKANAIAQAILLSLQGPKGWIILAGAAVAAGLAVWGVTVAMDKQADSLRKLQGDAQGHADAMSGVATAAEDAAKAEQTYFSGVGVDARRAAASIDMATEAQERFHSAASRQVGAVDRNSSAGFSAEANARTTINQINAADRAQAQRDHARDGLLVEIRNGLRHDQNGPVIRRAVL